MPDNLNLHARYTSTGIVVEARDESGRMLAWREIGRAKMLHWVEEHADRDTAIAFDHAVTAALDRDDEEHGRPSAHGNLAGLFDACALLNRVAAGVEEIAS